MPWSTNRAAWALSAIERGGRYYFYLSAGDGAGLGIAVADHPAGPFRAALGRPLVAHYLHGAQPIDAHAFLDDDGQAYLYFGGWSHAVVVRLGEDMVSLGDDFLEITPENYVEGPFLLKRRGVCYFMWSEGGWADSSYAVAYAKVSSPLEPFARVGRVLENNPAVGLGAGHHSALCCPGTDDWYIACHRRPLSETNGHHRVVCLDRMYFDGAGDITLIILTDEGVPARPLPVGT